MAKCIVESTLWWQISEDLAQAQIGQIMTMMLIKKLDKIWFAMATLILMGFVLAIMMISLLVAGNNDDDDVDQKMRLDLICNGNHVAEDSGLCLTSDKHT